MQEVEKILVKCLERAKAPSLEAGDIYFMLGVFYYSQHYLRKAEGCFTLS